MNPERLYLMQVAHIPGVNVPIVCYLVQMSDGTNVLIDSGLPDTLPPGRTIVFEKNVVEQLALIGLQPSDIDIVICTHFDSDHAGRLENFRHAPFVVQRTHYDNALSNPRFGFTRAQWDDPAQNYRFVDGDVELFPGVELIETSGHTTGHQSVLLHLPESGAVLLAIDAVTTETGFVRDRQPSPMYEDEDPVTARVSTHKLLDLAEREHVSLSIFGHDAQQWPTLKKLPEFYA
ncbi:MAG: MBL fold metallo-hydrolase [Chloroflexi bacterium]|nr:MBL fold metallo-hydrolase [Chloroflexota bacterium]